MDDKKLTKTVLINIQSSVVLQYSGLPINSISVNYPPTAEPMGWASWVNAPTNVGN